MGRWNRAVALVGMVAGLGWVPGGVSAAPPEASVPMATSAKTNAMPPRIPAADFAARSDFNYVRMAPDGAHIAMQMRNAKEPMLVVMDTVTSKPVAATKLGDKVSLEWLRWAGPKKVLFSLSQMQKIGGDETKVTRLMVLNIENGESYFVGTKWLTAKGDDVLWVAPDGSSMLQALRRSYNEYPRVYRVSLDDPKDRGDMVQSEMPGVWDWYADDAGVVRLGFGYSGSKVTVYYRSSANDSLRRIAKVDPDDDSDDNWWNVLKVVEGSDQGYVIRKGDNGRKTLQLIDYSTGEKIKTIYANPDWDVDDVWFDKQGKPYAVTYTDDIDRVVWLDPKLAELQQRLDKALAEPEVWIGSSAKDYSRSLISAGGPNDPGAIYLYDAQSRSLKALFLSNPKINPSQMATPKPITYTARDGTVIHGYLTLPVGRSARGLPLILYPHGGPYNVRDKLEYDSRVQFLANRGYAVLQPNYRGSGGYGEAFDKLGDGQIGRKMQDDLDDAMDWAVGQGIVDPKRVCVVGSSYGGYAAIWAVIRNPERYRCAASFAGVTDWKKQLSYDAGYFTSKGARAWRDRVSGDGFDLDEVSPARHADRLTRPLLLAQGDADTNVPMSQFKRMVKAAAKANVPVEQIVFEDEGHGFSKPENEQKWLETLDAFLARNNPAS